MRVQEFDSDTSAVIFAAYNSAVADLSNDPLYDARLSFAVRTEAARCLISAAHTGQRDFAALKQLAKVSIETALARRKVIEYPPPLP